MEKFPIHSIINHSDSLEVTEFFFFFFLSQRVGSSQNLQESQRPGLFGSETRTKQQVMIQPEK